MGHAPGARRHIRELVLRHEVTVPLQFNGQRIDDPEGREARDMEALGGIDRTAFWRFFLEGGAANNAALRALRWRS